MARRRWKEAEHPRDTRGRFAKKGSSRWFERALAEVSRDRPDAFNMAQPGIASGGPNGVIDLNKFAKRVDRALAQPQAKAKTIPDPPSRDMKERLSRFTPEQQTAMRAEANEIRVNRGESVAGAWRGVIEGAEQDRITGVGRYARGTNRAATAPQAQAGNAKSWLEQVGAGAAVRARANNPDVIGDVSNSSAFNDALRRPASRDSRDTRIPNLIAQMEGATSRGQAKAALDGLSKSDLKAIAREQNVRTSSSDTLAQLRDRLVNYNYQAKANSMAIERVGKGTSNTGLDTSRGTVLNRDMATTQNTNLGNVDALPAPITPQEVAKTVSARSQRSGNTGPAPTRALQIKQDSEGDLVLDAGMSGAFSGGDAKGGWQVDAGTAHYLAGTGRMGTAAQRNYLDRVKAREQQITDWVLQHGKKDQYRLAVRFNDDGTATLFDYDWDNELTTLPKA